MRSRALHCSLLAVFWSCLLCLLQVAAPPAKAAPMFMGLGDLPGGIFHSYPSQVSADGSTVVGSSQTDAGSEAFRWTAETGMVGLGDLPGGDVHSTASGVSADGSVVVGRSSSSLTPSDSEAFLWTADDGMVGLGGLSGPVLHSFASAVSADGSVVVGGSSGPDQILRAFRWTEADGMVGLGGLWQAYPRSWAEGVSADGETVVGSSTVGIGPDGSRFTGAFIWDSTNGMQNLQDLLTNEFGLDLTGWTLNYAEDISADGLTIIGAGYNPSGDIEGWIAVIPEPSTAVLLAVGLAGLAAAGRGRSLR